LSADVMLVIAPVPHFGFTIGPVLDLGLTGSAEIGTTDVDTTVTDVGLLAGLAGCSGGSRPDRCGSRRERERAGSW
jgi:hypothetical protein